MISMFLGGTLGGGGTLGAFGGSTLGGGTLGCGTLGAVGFFPFRERRSSWNHLLIQPITNDYWGVS